MLQDSNNPYRPPSAIPSETLAAPIVLRGELTTRIKKRANYELRRTQKIGFVARALFAFTIFLCFGIGLFQNFLKSGEPLDAWLIQLFSHRGWLLVPFAAIVYLLGWLYSRDKDEKVFQEVVFGATHWSVSTPGVSTVFSYSSIAKISSNARFCVIETAAPNKRDVFFLSKDWCENKHEWQRLRAWLKSKS